MLYAVDIKLDWSRWLFGIYFNSSEKIEGMWFLKFFGVTLTKRLILIIW